MLHHLRYWEFKLGKFGYNGKYWDDLTCFHSDLKKLVKELPPKIEEQILPLKKITD